MEKSWIVYEHVHKETGRRYIGITSQKAEARWHSGKGYKPGTHIRAAIDLYGWDAFEHNILYENLTEEEAKEIEVKLIKEYNTTEDGFNLTAGGEDTGTGLIRSEEARSHMRKPHGPISEDKRKNMGKANLGKSRSEETKTKISNSKMGIPKPKGTLEKAWEKRRADPEFKQKQHDAAIKREANKRAKREAQKAAET